MSYSLKDDSTKLFILKARVAENKSVNDISDLTGIPESTLRDFLNGKTYKAWWEKQGQVEKEEPAEPVFNGTFEEPDAYIKKLKHKTRFVITSAQNNTTLFHEFVDSLLSYCDKNDAEFLVSPYVYNLNGILSSKHNKEEMIAWHEKIVDHIIDEAVVLSDYLGGLIFCAELDILPTAVNPFSGLHSYTKSASGIIPHAKMQLESVPTHKSDPCRMLYTTGSITQRNYIQRKAGQKASFHHVYGALLVEVDHENKCWFVRQLNADSDGSFQDLDKIYHPDGTVTEGTIEAINWGDLHAEKLEPEQRDLCFGDGGILDTLRPKFQFCHDLSDFTPRNHHNRKDPHFLFRTLGASARTVEEGLIQAKEALNTMSRAWCQTVVVNSNHDNALLKWLKEADYRLDPENAHFFLKAQLACYDAMSKGDRSFSIFEHSLMNLLKEHYSGLKKIKFLREDESFKICKKLGQNREIECGYHGHTGANGSRGSVSTYQKLGSRVNIGHSHSATIKDGVYQAGVTGNLDMGYNIGCSSWSHSHIVTYPNGKRTIITTHGDKWRM